MPRDPLDRLPVGLVLVDGWGGPVGRDDNAQGLFAEGPLPAVPWLYRLLAVGMAQRAVLDAKGELVPQQEPLPPHLAVILTRSAMVDAKIRQMIRRARVVQTPTRRHRRTQRLTRYRAQPLAELRASA